MTITPTQGLMTINARVKTGAGTTVRLTLSAADDLKTAGGDLIPISKISWTAGGIDFVSGTMANGSAVTVGEWTGSGNRTGSQSFVLENSWDYPVGSYTTTATYTLSAI